MHHISYIQYYISNIAHVISYITYCTSHTMYYISRITYCVLHIAYCISRIMYCVLYILNRVNISIFDKNEGLYLLYNYHKNKDTELSPYEIINNIVDEID